MNIHVNRDGASLGQFAEKEILEGYRSGQFLDGDLVWRTGMKEWIPLVQFLTPSNTHPPLPPSLPGAPGSHNGSNSAGVVDVLLPTNPLAAVSCWIGIFSLVICPIGAILGPLAIFFGVMSLKVWKRQESEYGATASKIRTWIGITTGSLGTLLGAFILWNISKG
jgi:hypothetical protein